MGEINVIAFQVSTEELARITTLSLEDVHHQMKTMDDAIVKGQYLMVIELDAMGESPMMNQWILSLIEHKVDLTGSVGGFFVRSKNQHFTKKYTMKAMYLLNQLGMAFVGHALVEWVGDFDNFNTWKKKVGVSDLEGICIDRVRALLGRLSNYYDHRETVRYRNVLVLHAADKEVSNTYAFWQKVNKHLKGVHVRELHVENGAIQDCFGCDYETCKYHSKASTCFYGGVMGEDILPAIEAADMIVWVCPNYNDAVSAKLMAVINRLTVLYRRLKFYDKSVYAIIVSGSSGSDVVASQLISALNLNKAFQLPPKFSVDALANEALAILDLEEIDSLAETYANQIMAFASVKELDV